MTPSAQASLSDGPWTLQSIQVFSGTNVIPTATVAIRHANGALIQDSSTGKGGIDAVWKVIERIVHIEGLRFTKWLVRSLGDGADSQAEVSVSVADNVGNEGISAAEHNDTTQATAYAIVGAINDLLSTAAQSGATS